MPATLKERKTIPTVTRAYHQGCNGELRCASAAPADDGQYAHQCSLCEAEVTLDRAYPFAAIDEFVIALR